MTLKMHVAGLNFPYQAYYSTQYMTNNTLAFKHLLYRRHWQSILAKASQISGLGILTYSHFSLNHGHIALSEAEETDFNWTMLPIMCCWAQSTVQYIADNP